MQIRILTVWMPRIPKEKWPLLRELHIGVDQLGGAFVGDWSICILPRFGPRLQWALETLAFEVPGLDWQLFKISRGSRGLAREQLKRARARNRREVRERKKVRARAYRNMYVAAVTAQYHTRRSA